VVDLWRSVSSLRRDFSDMANCVRRDVAHVRSDLITSVRSVVDGLQRHLAGNITVRQRVVMEVTSARVLTACRASFVDSTRSVRR